MIHISCQILIPQPLGAEIAPTVQDRNGQCLFLLAARANQGRLSVVHLAGGVFGSTERN